MTAITKIQPSVHLPPPAHLTQDEAAVWRETVAAKPSDWFLGDVVPLLEEYCRVVVMTRTLALMVEAAIAGGDAKVLSDTLKMRDMESKRMTSIATKLRLTNQSRYTPDTAAVKAKKANSGSVWQFGNKSA